MQEVAGSSPAPPTTIQYSPTIGAYKRFFKNLLLPIFYMKWNKQAYGNGPKNSGNFSDNHQEFPEGSLSEDLPLEQAIEDFKMMAKVEGRAEKTLNLYDYVFDRFTELIDPETSIGEIEKKNI